MTNFSEWLPSSGHLDRLLKEGFTRFEVNATIAALARSAHQPNFDLLVVTLRHNFSSARRKRMVPIDWVPADSTLSDIVNMGYPRELIFLQIDSFLLKAWSEDVVSLDGAFKAHVRRSLPTPSALDERGRPALAVKYLRDVKMWEWELIDELCAAYSQVSVDSKPGPVSSGLLAYIHRVER